MTDTHTQTDTAWRHRLRLCIASHGKNQMERDNQRSIRLQLMLSPKFMMMLMTMILKLKQFFYVWWYIITSVSYTCIKNLVLIYNNNNNMIISKTMFMVLSSWQSHSESSPGSFDECRMAPSSRRPKTKPDNLGCESACTGCQSLHPPLQFIIITRPKSWYSFNRPMEGRRLSWPSWLVTYRDDLPIHRWSPILVLIGSDVVQLHWSRPTRYH